MIVVLYCSTGTGVFGGLGERVPARDKDKLDARKRIQHSVPKSRRAWGEGPPSRLALEPSWPSW
jgi:hypothetical protein